MDEPRAQHRVAGATRGPGWRIATPAVFAAAGVLLVTSAVTSGGTDLRPGGYGSLADLARQDTQRVTLLRERVADLQADVEELSEGLDSHAVEELQARADALAGPAGLTALRGPGVTVTLDDAPEGVRRTAGNRVVDAIVHQQD